MLEDDTRSTFTSTTAGPPRLCVRYLRIRMRTCDTTRSRSPKAHLASPLHQCPTPTSRSLRPSLFEPTSSFNATPHSAPRDPHCQPLRLPGPRQHHVTPFSPWSTSGLHGRTAEAACSSSSHRACALMRKVCTHADALTCFMHRSLSAVPFVLHRTTLTPFDVERTRRYPPLASRCCQPNTHAPRTAVTIAQRALAWVV